LPFWLEAYGKLLKYRKSQKPGGVPELGFALDAPLNVIGASFSPTPHNLIHPNMNVIPFGSRKRARSLPKRRSLRSRVPRSLRYDGETRLTRTVYGRVNLSSAGFEIGASSFGAVNIVYDVAGVTIYGNTTTSVRFDVPNSAEFAALYDLVKIDKVELTWAASVQASSDAVAYRAPRFLICNDFNDGATTVNLAEIQQHSDATSKFNADGTAHKWMVKPKYQRIVYYTALSSSYEPNNGFVNADTAIPHFGTKLGMISQDFDNSSVDFMFKYFLTLKNIK